MNIGALFIALLLSVFAFNMTAQEIQDPTPHPWLVKGILEFPFYSFYLGAPAVRGLAYLPNFSPRVGPKILYKDMGAAVNFGLPIPSREISRRGDSKQTSILLSNYGKRNAIDVYYQRIRGFYASSPFTELNFNKPERYPQFPDTRVLNAGINWYLVADPSKYNLKAAFEQTDFQKISGGSWIIHSFFNHLELSIGNEYVPGSGSQELTTVPNVASGRFETLGLALGYGHTLIRGHYFATAQGVWGPAVQYQVLDRNDGNDSVETSLAAKLNINCSIGYNSNDNVAGAKLIADSIWARVDNTEVSSSLVALHLFYGMRF